ncbi:MAG: methyltransferase domain-containing protein [Rhizobiaceae bacterium]
MVYSTHLLGTDAAAGRVLHLAPEPALYPLLKTVLHQGYLTADASPEIYPHAPCLKLFFPKDFEIFPDAYFSAILHNHVLEHIPGHYGDHLREFTRLLAPGGKMVFSIPGPYNGTDTREGGEHLASDAERLEQFLQEDHFKVFGDDLIDTLNNLPEGKVIRDGIDDKQREEISVRPGKAKFFIWQRDL